MNILDALQTILWSLLILVMPGIAFMRREDSWATQVGRMLLWSISSWILFLWTAAYLGLFTPWLGAIIILGTIVLIYKRRTSFFILENWWKLVVFCFVFLSLYAVLAVPLLTYHSGLPTGDSQKAIFWANIINQTGHLPDYSFSIPHLNRDPVDFYTPGLHALVALFTSNVVAVSFLGLALAASTAFIAAIWAYDMSDQKSLRIIILTILFVVTNLRFLRYIREPGYHLQNGLGELLLFGLLWVAITFRQRRRWEDILLGTLLATALILSHQFSSFIAAFMLLPIFIAFIFDLRSHASFIWRNHRMPVMIALFSIIILLMLGASLGLATKIPHIFTWQPHLLFEVPFLLDYPRLFGSVALCAGLGGFIVMLRKKETPVKTWEQRVFVASAIFLLALSQGPRLGIDIPPVRALLYAAVPLSIGAAFFFDAVLEKLRKTSSLIAYVFLLFPLLTYASTALNLSHDVRTNSTLRPDQIALADLISKRATTDQQAVLVDSYDQQSLSWLLLSTQPVFSRIAADLSVQMDEAKQSTLRRALYLNQLDYEKIMSLGNRAEVAPLLDKHSIRWITGVDNTTTNSLSFNPLLTKLTENNGVTLFETRAHLKPVESSLPPDVQNWLLKSSTLANDIGDDQDTFEQLPASIRTTRLSEPVHDQTSTWRETSAPLIPLAFNVGDYVRVLWSQVGLQHPDEAVELLIQFKGDPQGLTIETSDGKVWPVQNNKLVRIEASSLTWDDHGFATLILHNPQQQTIGLDLIALGLARIP